MLIIFTYVLQGDVFQSDFKPKFTEIHAIGTVACNNRWFDVCIQWYEIAKPLLSSIKDKTSQNDYVKEFIQHYNWAIEAHDKYLDLRGPTSKNHRTFALPFDEKLRKKKKYKKVRKSGQTLVNKIRDYHPLFLSSKKEGKDLNLKDNAMFICREGDAWRTPEMNKGNY